MDMYNNFDNKIESDYISLGRFSNNYFNISDNQNSNTNNRNVSNNLFNEYFNLGNKRFSSILRFLVILAAFISLLVLIKLPVKNRIELRKEILENALLLKKKHEGRAYNNYENKNVEQIVNSTQMSNVKQNKTGSLILEDSERVTNRSSIIDINGNVTKKDNDHMIKDTINLGGNTKLDVVNSVFGSHYNTYGINKRAAENDICNDKDYTKKVLKLVYELSYFALPKDTLNIRKFEASDVKVFNEEMWVVCDNSWTIGKFGLSLTPFSHSNKLLNMQTTTSGGNPLDINTLLLGTDPNTEDSQWEAIVRDDITGHLFVIRESIPHDLEELKLYKGDFLKNLKDENHNSSRHYHSHIIELALVKVNNVESYEVLETCTAEHKFDFDNKGFEGAIGLRTRNGDFYLLGLCEGNFCMGEMKGEEYGNGRLILMKKEYINKTTELTTGGTLNSDMNSLKSKCIWKSVRMINIPKEANFQDYSSIDVRGNKVAITSQEDSSIWIGEIDYGDGEYLDPYKIQLLPNGRVYYFPRDHVCDFKYCNIEGVSFISDNMIVTVSDKMKKKNRQSPKCLHKDQSIHIFAIP
ncbi:putative transmembrane domain-containing [Cryptosporidium hominis]